MSSGSTPIISSQNGKIIIDQENEQLTINDASNNHIALAGKDSTGNIVFKVAKPGYNAITATDDQLVFNSAQDALKVVKTGLASLPAADNSSKSGSNWSSNTNQTLIAHGLPFTPIIMAFIYNVAANNFSTPIPYTTWSSVYNGATNIVITTYRISVDATYIYLSTEILTFNGTQSSSATTPVKYYLLQETATP